MADERFHDHELDRFWDAVVNSPGGPVAGKFDLDPATIALDRFHRAVVAFENREQLHRQHRAARQQ